MRRGCAKGWLLAAAKQRGLTKGVREVRHAYLIIAHADWAQLERLLSLLDDPDNEIFVHVDAKAKDWPEERLRQAVKVSHVEFFQRYKIYWGSFEMVEATLDLLEMARKRGCDYYHLLSGADLPVRSQEEIHAFFEQNAGKEFVHFATDESRERNHEIGRRARLYHLFMHFSRRYRFQPLNKLFRWIDRACIAAQLCLGVNRLRRFPGLEVRYGSSWFSITDALAAYVLENRATIYEVFRYANSADELFLQTLVHNSPFRERLYHPQYDGSIDSNQRLVDWKRGKNGSPYTFRLEDFEMIQNSGCLFARKFSMAVDPELVNRMTARLNARHSTK